MTTSVKDNGNGVKGVPDLLQLVTFNISNEEFGLDILKVHEIIRMLEITRIPGAPEFVEGVINLRGRIIPVIDLRKRFNFEKKEPDKLTRIVVVEIEEKIVGFIVDSVSEVLRLPSSKVEPPPPIVGGIDSEYISGVGNLDNRLLILLDLGKLLTSKEIDILDEV